MDRTSLDFIPQLPEINAVLAFRNIRNERTGIHAQVLVGINDRIIESDTFNLGRAAERVKLARLAQNWMSDLELEVWNSLGEHIMQACVWVTTKWESFQIQFVRVIEEPPPPYFYLYPYIREGAGTILFAAPNSGKSYLLQTLAVTTAVGFQGLWESQRQAPVIYINLERDHASVERREYAIRRALGIDTSIEIPIDYPLSGLQSSGSRANIRGKSLTAVVPAVLEQLKKTPNAIVMLDSISRTSLGSLIEDQTANKIIDTMNLFGTWVAIGHTSRAESDHVFGSQHFDAGTDLAVKVSSQRNGSTLGVALAITKANDLPPVEPRILSFGFAEDGSGLEYITSGSKAEFPELLADVNISKVVHLRNYVEGFGDTGTTTTRAEQDTGLGTSFINRQFTKPTHDGGIYERTQTKQDGTNAVFYKVRGY